MQVLGHVAHPDVHNREYRLKTLDNANRPLNVATDSEGRLWLIVGTDSGFEGLTRLYYARISYTLTPAEPATTGCDALPAWPSALIAESKPLRSVLGWLDCACTDDREGQDARAGDS